MAGWPAQPPSVTTSSRTPGWDPWKHVYILTTCLFSLLCLDLALSAYGVHTWTGLPPGFLPHLIVAVYYIIMRAISAFFMSAVAGLKKRLKPSRTEWILALAIFGLPAVSSYVWISSAFGYRGDVGAAPPEAIMYTIAIAFFLLELLRAKIYLKAYRRFVLLEDLAEARALSTL